MRHRLAGRLRRGLEHQAMTGQLGIVYMLHFDRPYQHARHYVGWTADLLDRLDQHATGRGARLIAVIWQAGIGFTLVRICEGTRHTERAIKHAGGSVRYCPACMPHPWTGHWSVLPAGFTPRIYLNHAGRR
jgi:predicted GIY-YIG superfamily endonuclease